LIIRILCFGFFFRRNAIRAFHSNSIASDPIPLCCHSKQHRIAYSGIELFRECFWTCRTGVFFFFFQTVLENVYWSPVRSTRLGLRIYLHQYFYFIFVIRTPSVVVQNHCTPRDRELPTCYCAWPQKILFLQRKRSGKGNMIIVSVFTHRSRIPCTSYTT